MNYEIVTLQEKTVCGRKVRTNNQDPQMPVKIGALWQDFYTRDYARIPRKSNDRSIGLYTGYESDMLGDYDVLACCEVDGVQQGEFDTAVIPSGKYAKFIVRGDMQAVAGFWAELWKMELDRAYIADFEEYQSGGDMQDMEVHIYIGLK